MHVTKRSLLLAGSMTIAVALAAGLLDSIGSARENGRWIQHTYQVLLSSEVLLSELTAAETGQRGFRLTGNEVYLEPYYTAIRAVPATQHELRRLTVVDNAVQSKRLDALDGLIARRLKLMSQAIDLTRAGRPPQRSATFTTGEGEITTGKIRALIGEVTTAEQSLLAERQNRAERQTMQTFWAVGIGGTGLLFLLSWAMVTVEKDFAERQRVERDLLSNRKALEASERLLRNTFENAAVGIGHVAPGGRWQHVNERLCSITGYSSSELSHRSVEEITHPTTGRVMRFCSNNWMPARPRHSITRNAMCVRTIPSLGSMQRSPSFRERMAKLSATSFWLRISMRARKRKMSFNPPIYG